jgi:hydrogenase maturation protease
MIRIIGIGSPFGDDAAGLVAAQKLAAAPPPGVEVVAADRPGAALIELLDSADAVILIDAVHSGARPGTVYDLDLRALPQDAIGLVSSHDLGVIEAVQLASALGRAPVCGRVLAIETAPDAFPNAEGEISAAIWAGVGQAAVLARQWAERFVARITPRVTATAP